MQKLPPRSTLFTLFSYYPIIGEFRYRNNKKFAGNKYYRKDGTPHNIRVTIYKYGSRYVSHIIWKMMTGNDPIKTIDHKNNDPFDNRWKNLREATITEQLANRRIRKDNTHGYKGVGIRKGVYYARIYKNKKAYWLGNFNTPQEAHQAYCDAADQLYRKFANYG